MLDEFGTELETADSKLDSTMKKVAKVMRMSNGRYIHHKLFHFSLPFEKINLMSYR